MGVEGCSLLNDLAYSKFLSREGPAYLSLPRRAALSLVRQPAYLSSVMHAELQAKVPCG